MKKRPAPHDITFSTFCDFGVAVTIVFPIEGRKLTSSQCQIHKTQAFSPEKGSFNSDIYSYGVQTSSCVLKGRGTKGHAPWRPRGPMGTLFALENIGIEGSSVFKSFTAKPLAPAAHTREGVYPSCLVSLGSHLTARLGPRALIWRCEGSENGHKTPSATQGAEKHMCLHLAGQGPLERFH